MNAEEVFPVWIFPGTVWDFPARVIGTKVFRDKIPGSWLEAKSWEGASKLTALKKVVYYSLGLWLLGLKKAEKFESTLIPGAKSSHLLP